LPSPDLAPSALEAARVAAAVARRRESDARAALEQVVREAASRATRLAALAREEETWQRQRDRSAAHRATLTERRDALETQLAEIAARPAAIAVESAELAQRSLAAAAELSTAEDRLAVAETAFRAATEAARQAENTVSQARECRAGISARCDAAADTVGKLRNEIASHFGDTPENLAAAVRDTEEEATDDVDGLAARLDRLQRERDGMGPVNLLAEQETAEVEARIVDLERERADLTAAIARLRRGIATLDQEGRRRLVAAFEQLNRHFGELFVRLFGGGRAELTWADDGDPLTAGLDILASPPGKRLDSLSLLSGGEQALTALALLFAVFVTNPAPLCVLDEADAPLDDANVDAFCRLVSEIADATGTRFLLITHHRVTMARMDRLFGVTMAERGVSQLVSVDLSRAVELRQSA
jgi:chromosome segregation protein